MQIAMLNDRIMPLGEVGPEYLDRGTFFGDGVYEVLRSYNGRIFALEEHFARLEKSLAAIEIPVLSPSTALRVNSVEGTDVKIGEIRSRVLGAFEKAGIKDAKIYFHITRGSGLRDHLPERGMKPNFFLTITELKDNPELKNEGIAVSTYPDIRWKRCDIKTLNLMANVLARNDAKQKGCEEAIFVNEDGLMTEGAGSAFLGIVDSKLRTAPLSINILPSITRKYVIKAAGDIGLNVEEKPLQIKEAAKAEELFIAVTTKDIVPIVKFDGQTIGDGRPGKWTRQLIEEFKKFTK